MRYRQMYRSGLLYVISVPSWVDWILPFLPLREERGDLTCWERGSDAAPVRLLASLQNAVVLLSHHDTLQRDAVFAQGRSNVLAQPLSVASLAHDKRAMAAFVGRVPGLSAIPELTLEHALDHLAGGAPNAVVLKRVDGTEGKGLQIADTPEALRAAAAGLAPDAFLLQPALEGHEYSVNLITDGEVCHVYRPVSKGTNRPWGLHPAQRVRKFPAPVPEPESIRLMTLAASYALAIGARGLIEIELLQSRDQIYFVEMNPRLSATLRMSILSSRENLIGEMHRILRGGLETPRFVEADALSIEIPLPRGLSGAALDALFQLGNVHISSRITLTAPTMDELTELQVRASRILSADGHARAATSLHAP